jgi:hypothetical protein
VTVSPSPGRASARRASGPITRPLRQGIDAAREALRLWRVKRSVRALRAVTTPDTLRREAIRQLHQVWGNHGWAADASFLWELATRAARGPGPFLECGSGLSTVVAAALAGRYGAAVWSLEQDEAWYRRMARALSATRLDNVVLVHAPLRSYGDFVWYDVEHGTLPPTMSAVFCDGPAVSPSRWTDPHFSSWRSGVVPVLRELGITFGELLLDDADDQRCPQLRQRWEEAGVRTEVRATADGPFIVGTPRGAGAAG